MPLKPETRHQADEIMKHFFVPFHLEDESRPIQNLLSQLPQSFLLVAETFIDRLNATIQTTSAPFIFANAASHSKRHQTILRGCEYQSGI